MFQAANKELSHNFIETNRKSIVTNATWFQTIAIRFLQTFMDADAVRK